MILPAYPHSSTTEEQGRLLEHVYAFILSDKFTGNHKEQNFQWTTPPVKTCKPHLTGIIQVVDAQALLPLEARE